MNKYLCSFRAGIRRMWRIVQMWGMVFYFKWNRRHLASLHRIADPEIEEVAKTVSPVFAGMIAVHKRKGKITVAKGIFLNQFVLQNYPHYLFTRDRKFGYVSARLKNFPKYLDHAREVFEDCFKYDFFEESKEYSNYFFITVKGEIFGETPLGLILEELKYIGSIPMSIFRGGV